ncbi:MAG: cytochrome P450 [Elainellaceae cyanobacterium]
MKTLPNGPQTLPLLQLASWLRDPLRSMETAASQFGGCFTLRWSGLKTLVMVSDPEALQIMLTSPALTAPGEANALARPLLGDRSLILLSGMQHQQRRKLLMPPFHGERLFSYGQLIRKITRQVSAAWQPQQPFLVREAMQEITLRVILQAVFGLNEGDRLEQLKRDLVTRLDMTSAGLGSLFIFLPSLQRDWGAWSPWGRVMQQQRACDRLIYEEIRDRRANPDPDRIDILNLLLTAKDEDGQQLTDVDLRDELMTLLFAGHETTATALTWALYWVHRYPEIYAKLIQEIESLGDNPDPLALFKLPYLTAVCNETLRIYPVGMLTFSRVVQSPVEIGGCMLTPGTEVIGSIYLTHHREDLYPNPKQFRPERFLERQYSPYEFLPFGGGSRRCLGMALAQFEMKLVLATLLQDLKLRLTDANLTLQPVRRGALLAPEASFAMIKTGDR